MTRHCPEVRRDAPHSDRDGRAPKKIIRNFFGKGLFFRNISEIFREIRNYSASFNAAFQEGRRMGWERARLARGVWRPAKHILVRKCGARRTAQRPGPPPRCCGAIKRSRSPDIPAIPSGATERAHGRILAQRAEFVQVMVTIIFKTQNPCKHWSKRVS